MTRVLLPHAKRPTKSSEEICKERKTRVKVLIDEGYLRSERLIEAMLKVPREAFVTTMYRDYTYDETPLPIPGCATISCPHSYPLFYEALSLKRNDRVLEIGTGSGYGAALAREVVGEGGKVVSVEIDKKAYTLAKNNLNHLGYHDIMLILGDGVTACQNQGTFEKIACTASLSHSPVFLLELLTPGGRLAIPIGPSEGPQDLNLFEKCADGEISQHVVCQVHYMALKGS
jgi:protein-L-isoaspartate(D-aspartate) O-methyltransferase